MQSIRKFAVPVMLGSVGKIIFITLRNQVNTFWKQATGLFVVPMMPGNVEVIILIALRT